jgi:cytochrome P450
MHDESTYKKHSDFNPDRFLREIPEMDPNIVAFGWGRRSVPPFPLPNTLPNFFFARICPGINLAKEEMFLIIVQTLAIFKFLKPLNAEGQEVMPRVEFTSTVLKCVCLSLSSGTRLHCPLCL